MSGQADAPKHAWPKPYQKTTGVAVSVSKEVLSQLEKKIILWGGSASSDEEASLLQDCADGSLDSLSLFQASLLAGGTPVHKILRYEELLKQHVDALRALTPNRGDDLETLRRVFGYLHHRILTGGYEVNATNPAIAFDRGQFNCVSAAILFKLLTEAVGYRATIQQLPTHAFCRVKTDKYSIPVECTAPRWLDNPDWLLSLVTPPRESDYPGNILVALDEARRPVSIATPNHQNLAVYTHGRTKSDVEVLGTIYYNRGVDYLFDHKYAEALAANVVAIRLDPSNKSAKENLLASLNNWAISLAEAGRFKEASERLFWALRCAPEARPVQANLVRLYRQWQSALAKTGREKEFEMHLQEALRNLESIGQTGPAKEWLRQLSCGPAR